MKRFVIIFIILVCSVALAVPMVAKADGMIMPPHDQWVQETDQRAVIMYDKGIESMVISTTFRGNAEDFGWVVPVPSKPTVTKGSDELFTTLNSLTGTTYRENAAVFGLGSVAKDSGQGVTVIETKKVDYYDVTVLSATDEGALTKWLADNKYNFPASAGYILDSYIQNKWYFVAMRVNPQGLEWSDVEQKLRTGHATPVLISFATKNIVYPMKISSIISRPDETEPVASTATPTYDSNGALGKAITLTAKDTLTFPATSAFPASGGTIEIWVKPDSTWNDYGSGYWELVNVVDTEGQDIFELRRGKGGAANNLQLVSYSPTFEQWKSANISWLEDQWHFIAVTWQPGSKPHMYLDGVEQTVSTAYSGSAWTPSVGVPDTIYFGQRGTQLGTSALRGGLDEVRFTSTQKTASEILATYQSVNSAGTVEVEDATTFLAHFDNNLQDVKSAKDLVYGTVPSSSISYNEMVVPAPDTASTVSVMLYVIADHRKELPNFTTGYANWIKKGSIENLALNDQGDPLLQPSNSKYFLTKLTRTMSYEDMTEDLFLRDADSNATIGDKIETTGTRSTTSFYIIIGVSLALTIALLILFMVAGRTPKPPLPINK